MGDQTYFTPELFRFLRDLKAHNSREWFEKNRDRYEADVKGPMLRFIADFRERLQRISRHFSADPQPVGGSMFRLHRDIRFAKDKSPYKTNVGAHFPHLRAGRDAHAPGFYLHLEPGRSFGGGGLWHPDAPALKKIRDEIVGRSRDWKALRARLDVQGESLKRVPAGYNPAHPLAADLRLKDFYSMAEFSERDVCSRDFLTRYAEVCRRTSPLLEFLTKALGMPW